MIHHAGVVYRLSFLQFDVDFTACCFPLRHIPVNPKRMSKRFIQIPPAKMGIKKAPVSRIQCPRTSAQNATCGTTLFGVYKTPSQRMLTHSKLCNVSSTSHDTQQNRLSLRPQGSICPIRVPVGFPASPTLCECAFGFISLSKVFYTLPQKSAAVKSFFKFFRA